MKFEEAETLILTFIIQLVGPVGTMKQNLCSGWLPKWVRWDYLACLGLTALISGKYLFINRICLGSTGLGFFFPTLNNKFDVNMNKNVIVSPVYF